MAEATSHKSTTTQDRQLLSMKDFFQACLHKWAWILVSVVVFSGLGYLYIKCQEPEYQRSEEILIKDQESGGGIGGMSSTFASMGLISGNTNVYNELISITSPAILSEVINRLHLNENYIRDGFFHGTTLYGTTLPFEAKFLDLDLQDAADFRCDVRPDGTLRLYDFISYSKEGKKIKHEGEVSGVKVGSTVKTPLGQIQFVNNQVFDPTSNPQGKTATEVVLISKMGHQSAIEHYAKKVQGSIKDEYADVIEITAKDVSIERAVDILNEILNVYNENWVEDKNKIAKATSAFIEDRLRVIEKELGEVDTNIARYRSKTSSIDPEKKGVVLLEKDDMLERQIVNLGNTLTFCEYMVDYLKDPSNRFNVIPNNTGVQSEEVEKQIQAYNELLLDRNSLESSSSASNPLVQEYDAQLDNLRRAIMKGMTNRTSQLQQLIASSKRELSKARGLIQETPVQSLPLLSEQRQQSVKENLYLFLLEKREENELSQKFTADNTRVITPPMGSLKPIAPKKMFIMLFMFVFGLVLPLLVIYIRETNDTKVRAKKDLDNVKIPFAGEIPQVGKATNLKALEAVGKLRHRKDEKAPLAVVEEGKRDVVNEAFRVIRSNIDFMVGKSKGRAEIIMLTSFNPGSGKSFISYNLGLSFAIKKKRVLLIDCDLRHGSSSMYVNMPTKGLTNYLTDATDDWKSLVKKSPSVPSIDILPVGKMPPNPAELLENGRLELLLKEAEGDYDFILLDCPPANIVVDTQIVGQLADRTLFVVRAGLLEKSALKELNEFYDEKKFKNMSVLLNGTTAVHSRYYTYGTYQNYTE